MRNRRVRSLKMAVVLLFAMAASSTLWAQATQPAKLRWDIVSIQFGSPNISSPGGLASAWAYDTTNGPGIPRQKITLTGSGTFSAYDPSDVTGGGSWTIVKWDPKAMQILPVASGTYTVTGFVSFTPLPGTQPANQQRAPGFEGESRAGVAVFRIAYSDNSRGILVVSCHLIGTPDDTFEGVVATKDGISFVNHESPVPRVDADRTVFTVLAGSGS
jgi:hypothetical protein